MPRPAPPLRPVAMLTHSYYDEDPRVRREAEAIVRAGRPVDVYALRRAEDAATSVVDGVTVHRLDVQRHQGASLRTYLGEYLEFFARAALATTAAQGRRRYALVQVHTLPDFLVFAVLQFRLAGIPVLLDLHEAMPEFFRVRFPRAASPLAQAALGLQERFSIAAASAAITVNDALATRLRELGVAPDRVHVIRNTPDLGRFDPARFASRQFMADGVLRLAYAGALTPTYELEVVVDAIAELRRRRSDLPVALDLYGRGDSTPALEAQVASAGLADAAAVVRFHGRIPIEAVPAALAGADIGLAPTRRTAFTDYSLSTKIFEYAAMGKPVVASRLPLVEETFGESVATYEPGSAGGLAAAILAVVDDPERRAGRVDEAAVRVRALAWERESQRYLALVEGLAADGSRRPGRVSSVP